MMQMTFGAWSDYEVKVLWEWWNISTKGQMALSWFIIVAATVCCHAIKYSLEYLEVHKSVGMGKEDSGSTSEGLLTGAHKVDITGSSSSSSSSTNSSSLKFYIMHSLIAALYYCVSLLLMLVAMTYNVALFMALVVGWALGDFIFFKKVQALRRIAGNHSLMTDAGCH